MSGEFIPDDVRNFIQRYIDSIAQLEALLLLRSTPNEDWDTAKMAKRLYTTEHQIAEALARLCDGGFLSCTNGVYRYECGAKEQRMVDQLASVYSRHLIPVTNMIHAKPRRIREFADAFKFRKDL